MSVDGVVRLRSAAPGDYAAIVRLWTASGLLARTAGRDGPKAFRRQLLRFPTLYIVAEVDGRLAGVVLGSHDTRKGWINRIAVHPDHRRRGIGRQLVRACEQAFIEQGIEIFAALVEIENAGSAALFEQTGYKRDIPVHYFHKRLRSDV